VLGEVVERLSSPAVPGEILAGIALGPYALAIIPDSDTLHSIAEVGAIFVLFSAGLETSAHGLIQVSRKALLVSVVGVAAPFVLGFAYPRSAVTQPLNRFSSLPPWSPPALASPRECWQT
jgi:Na+:H+ antiporter